MLIPQRRAWSVVRGCIRQKLLQRVLFALLVWPTWTLTHRHRVTRALLDHTRQLLQSSAQHALQGLQIWTVHHPQYVRHVPVAHTLMGLRHHAQAV